jgi:hypothetical protein
MLSPPTPQVRPADQDAAWFTREDPLSVDQTGDRWSQCYNVHVRVYVNFINRVISSINTARFST